MPVNRISQIPIHSLDIKKGFIPALIEKKYDVQQEEQLSSLLVQCTIFF